MKLFKGNKNNLDEMQEQKLLRLESRGFWLIWWALLAAMAVQLLVYGVEAYHLLLGEWAVFMLSSVYMTAACIKQGLWDRKLKPNFRTNLLLSLLDGGPGGRLHLPAVPAGPLPFRCGLQKAAAAAG